MLHLGGQVHSLSELGAHLLLIALVGLYFFVHLVPQVIGLLQLGLRVSLVLHNPSQLFEFPDYALIPLHPPAYDPFHSVASHYARVGPAGDDHQRVHHILIRVFLVVVVLLLVHFFLNDCLDSYYIGVLGVATFQLGVILCSFIITSDVVVGLVSVVRVYFAASDVGRERLVGSALSILLGYLVFDLDGYVIA